MKREVAKKWAVIFAAMAEGKKIQYKQNGKWSTTDSVWVDLYSPDSYRIAPDPVELWVWYHPNPPAHLRNIIGASENCASDDDFWKDKGYTKIKVREVQD